MSKRLFDTVLNEYVPEDVYVFIENDNDNRIAEAVKDWEDVTKGEFWYPNHAEVHDADHRKITH